MTFVTGLLVPMIMAMAAVMLRAAAVVMAMIVIPVVVFYRKFRHRSMTM